MKMKTFPIEIDGIENDLRYANIAFLVDRPSFLIAIKRARKAIGLTNTIKYEDVYKWPNKDSSRLSMVNASFRLSMQISSIKHKFKKGISFTDVIKYAILSGKVTDKEFTSAAFCVEYPLPGNFEDFLTDDPLVAIFVSPNTKIKDVEYLMNTQVKSIFQKRKYNNKNLRTSGLIKRDRKWYWLHQDGKSYKEIVDMDYRETLNDRDIVIKAIQQYKKNLGVEM